MDADGDMDAVGGMDAGGAVVWYENTGAQYFVEHVISADLRTLAVHVADVNGDGEISCQCLFCIANNACRYMCSGEYVRALCVYVCMRVCVCFYRIAARFDDHVLLLTILPPRRSSA